MNKLFLLVLLSGLFFFNACKDKDEDKDLEPEYHINILSPDSSEKIVGTDLQIKIEFEDHNGGTVHHVNVRVYNKTTGAEIYNLPVSAHVHETSPYTYEDNLTLNVDPATHWVLEAKVWGHDDGVAEVSEKIEFHVKQ